MLWATGCVFTFQSLALHQLLKLPSLNWSSLDLDTLIIPNAVGKQSEVIGYKSALPTGRLYKTQGTMFLLFFSCMEVPVLVFSFL